MEIELQAKLADAIRSAGMPGASVCVWFGEAEWSAAAGVLNVQTGVEATTDSVFQIGSITKALTATLILQFRDKGLLDLNDPLGKYLPRLQGTSLENIPILCLLGHSGGSKSAPKDRSSRQTQRAAFRLSGN